MRLIVLAAVLGVAACSRSPVYRHSEDPLPVAPLDQTRYLGLWHQQARLPNRMESGCQRVTTEYRAGEDGLLTVHNTCLEVSGERRIANGRARLVGESGEGKLEVNFSGLFWADHWVLDRDPDYSWSIVGEPGGRSLWVLTRSARITPEQRAAFEARITQLGYRPADLVWAQD